MGGRMVDGQWIDGEVGMVDERWWSGWMDGEMGGRGDGWVGDEEDRWYIDDRWRDG
jgi:hypothetical protein